MPGMPAYQKITEAKMKRCAVCENKVDKGRLTCSISCRNSLNARNSNKNRYYPPKICELCKKEYVPHSTHQRFCTEPCRRRGAYERNIGTYQKRDKKKIRANRIGLNIRDAHMQTPSKHAKWLWDGMGRWSVKYWPEIRECLECGLSLYKHRGNGVCEYCYDRNRSRTPEELKQVRKRAYEKAKAAGKKFSGQQAREWIKRAKERKIPISPTIQNLLDNLEEIEAS